MILKAIQPTNFGPFAVEQRIEFEDAVTVLTGPNDVGKSAVLRLIAKMFRDTQEGALTEQDVNTDHIQSGRTPWKSDTTIGCKAEFKSTELTKKYLDIGKLTGETLIARCSLAPDQFRVIVESAMSAKGSRHVGVALTQFPKTVVLPRKPEVFVSDQIHLRNLNLCEREFLGIAFGAGFKPEAFDGLSVMNFKGVLQKGAKSLNRALRSLLPPTAGLEFDLTDLNNDRKTVGVHLIDTHGGFVPASLRGTGFRRLLSVLGILLARFSDDEHFVVLYDEPESSLHADAQHSLRRVLEEIARKPNVQVIYATHSPSMINTMRPEAIRVFSRKQIEGKACTAVDNKPFGENFAAVRTSLGITAADSLLYAPITIVVEGRTEVACLVRALLKLHIEGVAGFGAVPQLLDSCHVLDGQGDNLESLCRLAKSQGASPIVFVDGDKIRQLKG